MTVAALRQLPAPRSIVDLLWEARSQLDRLTPHQTHRAQQAGALLVDIRPHPQRVAEGEIPDAQVLDRNVLEWRLAPSSDARLPEASYDRTVVVVCSQGDTSSLAAATLQAIGLSRATDLEAGFRAWREAGLAIVPGGTPAGERSRRRSLLEVDVDCWQAYVAGDPVRLTAQEFRALSALHAANGRVVTRESLSISLDMYPSGARALDVHICRLRRKLGPVGPQLVTVRSIGWRLLPT